MKIYFSLSTQGFYHDGVQKNIPSDAKQISKKVYTDIYEKLSSGYVITEVSEDSFSFIESISESPEKDERHWRDSELQRADIELYKVQDSDPKAEKSVAEWREYRKNLRAWPDHIHFPNKDFRPTAPDL